MSSLRTLVPILFLALLAGPASAQIQTLTLGSAGTVNLVPPGPIAADGNRISLTLLVTDQSGALADGVRFRGSSASAGRFDGECRQVGKGLYDCPYTTPTRAGAAQLSLKARLPSGSELNASYPLEIVREDRARVTMSADPARLVLTRDAASSLVITVTDEGGVPVEGGRLTASANVGTIDGVAPLGGGRYSATYRPPQTPFPQVAIISVWDQEDPGRVFGFFTIPLIGKVDYPVNVQAPGVNLVFTVGGTTFPPATSGADGIARVPIEVPPGVSEATVQMTAPNGASQTQKIDLQVPPFNRVSVGGAPDFVPADGRFQTRIRAFVVDRSGRPADGQNLSLATTQGSLSAPRFVGNGLYEAVFTAPLVSTPSSASITAALAGEEMSSSDTLEIGLEPGGPASLSLIADPAQITPSVNKVKLRATLTDESGAPLGGHAVEFRTPAGPISNPKSQGVGAFEAELPVQWNVRTPVQAVAAIRGNRRPVADLVGLPLSDQVLTNQGMPVTVVSVDRYGNPVANVALNASVILGGGSVTNSVQTDGSGLGTVRYTAGPIAGLAIVRFRSADGAVTVDVPLWQGTAAQEGFEFPVAGGQQFGRLNARWRKLRARMTLGQAPAPVTAQTPATTGGLWGQDAGDTGSQVGQDLGSTAQAGAVSRIEVAAVPASVAATGGSVNILVRALDPSGLLVPGQNIILLTDTGTISNKVDNGDGTFSAVLVIPAGTGKTAAQVTATRAQGDIAGFGTVAIGGAAVAAQPTPKQPKPPKQPADPGDRGKHRFAQIMIGWAPGVYSYDSEPCAFNVDPCTPPADADLDSYDFLKAQVDAPLTGSFAVDGEIWPVEYVGAHVSYARLSYQTDFGIGGSGGSSHCATHFCDAMNFFNLDVQGRLPLLRDKGPLDIIARLGYEVQDLVVFRRIAVETTDDEGNVVVEKSPQFQTMVVHGLRIGAGLRYTIIPQLRPHLNYDLSISLGAELADQTFGLTGISNHHFALGLSALPWKGLLFDFTYHLQARSIASLGWPVNENGVNVIHSGHISEMAHTFRLSAGWAF